MGNETETRERLLEVAKQEFLELGYEKASMRKICKKAGVTTGALYFFFKDKNDLFAALVKKVADEIKMIIVHHTQKEKDFYMEAKISPEELIRDGIQQGREFVTYMYANKDEFILLLSKSYGSKYENFYDELVVVMEMNSKEFLLEMPLSKSKREEINDYTIHWLAHLETSSFAQLLTHDLTLEEALQQSEVIAKYLAGGWLALMEYK
ncbi:MAG: TetR/AcrR family transcriptional regulator [Acetobacterium sp.]|nr:TetR/AcrR family transcriptional regulator [Bacillota bacterium]MCG2728945.1 TetR/AcrR family transcriptional regulator [Acetobacterium sp.]